MKFLLLPIALITVVFASAQQGNNFSMWFKNNMQHNPAAVGTNSNNMKVFANFRYQYFSVTDKPFQTISASAEGRILESDKRYSHFGIGVNFVNDMSGDGRYMVNNISIPIAYHIYFDDKNSISLGVSPGLYQRSISNGNLTWESQWNGYEFDQAGSPHNISNISVSNFDLGAGIFYKHQSSRSNKFYLGFSAKHILEPALNFRIQDNMFIRYIGQVGLSHRFYNSDFGISPQVLTVFQGPNQNIIFGSNFDYYLQDPSKRTLFYTPTVFSFGVYHRLQEAIIVNFQYSFKGMTIAASYDSNINTMLPASKSVGGFEVAVMYDIMFNRKRKFIW